MIFYLIENGKVLGWQYGTDVEGDPTSTGVALREWAKQAGRSIVAKEGHETEEPKFLKHQNGEVMRMDQSEKQTVIDAESQDAASKKALEDSAFDKIATAAGLTEEEKEAHESARKVKG